MQRWRSLGHVYVAAGEGEWLASHASYPTPLVLPDATLRVFFSPRDARGRSSIFSLDLALEGERWHRLGPPDGPWLEPGPRGAFDDAGASIACALPAADGSLEAYYLGWTLGVSVPFRTAIGLARAAPGAHQLERASLAPEIDRAPEDPFLVGYPWVVASGEARVAWYGTHLAWGGAGLEMTHAIRRARRAPGRGWVRDAVPALLPAGNAEYALSRPSVLQDAAGWHMWCCRRLPDYRLGYAHSEDGLGWTRADDALAFVGEEAPWEVGARCYPAVFDHGGRRYMLHNGAGFGRTGFGLAVLER